MASVEDQERAVIGVIGLGNMGRGIARNFIRAGHLVHVWDTAKAALDAFVGEADITPPSAMAAHCALIVFVVPGSREIDAMMSGPSNLLEGAHKDLVLFDFTTSDPDDTRRLAARAADNGVAYMDAGMTGGATHADEGELTLMIGGDEEALRRTAPLLQACTRRLIYLGPSGAGHTMKLLHNMITHTNFLAVCEAAHLAKRAGIDVADMIEVFNNGNARSFISERRFPDHILSGTYDGRSPVFNLHKDLGMAMRLADALGATVNLGRDTFAYLKAAVHNGMVEEDFTRLYARFEDLAGTADKATGDQGS